MVAFYNQGDQDIYKSGQHFVPQEKYRLGYTAPVQGGGQDASTPSFGIPATQAFTNSGGGGGGGNYSGGYNFGNTGFQQAVDARQNRLNKPIDTSTFMGKAKDFMNPQSANDIMTSGYQEPRFQPGIIGAMMGKLDNYRNLSQADQAFISQNMGYTGPTVFGENNSGLGKDPFGINTRSAFGNYGEYVGKAVTDLEEALEKAKGKYTNKKGIFDKDLYNKRTQLMQKKLKFYKGKTEEREDLQADALAGQMKRDREAGAAGKSDSQDQSRAGSSGRRPGSGGNVDRVTEGPGQNVSNVDNQAYDSGGREGYGYGLKKGGRAGYFFGGRARLQGGGRVNFKNGGLASIL